MTEQKDGTGWSRREWLAGAGAGVAAALLANPNERGADVRGAPWSLPTRPW